MTWEIAFVLLLLIGGLVSFVWEKVPPDVTAIALFLVIVLSGLLTEARAFSVLANPAPLTVAAMFVLSAALVKCGAIDRIAALLDRVAGFHYFTIMLLMMLGVGAVSAFVNNTPVVVVFVPVILKLARKMNQPASKLLIPLSYAAVLGGSCTLLGTSTNLVVAGIVRDRGLPPISMFELAWVGLPLAAIGAVYVAVLGKYLLPARDSRSPGHAEDGRRDYLIEVTVGPASLAVGRTPAQVGLKSSNGIRVREIVRSGVALTLPLEAIALAAGDRLVLSCGPKGVAHARSVDGLELLVEKPCDQHPQLAQEGVLVEGIVGPNSGLIGRSPCEVDFRELYRADWVAVHRPGLKLERTDAQTPLKFGDILLLMGTEHAIEHLRGNHDLLLIDRPPLPSRTHSRHLFIVLSCIAGVVLASTLRLLNIEVAALLACLVVFATGCLKPKDGYQAIEWNLLILIYGMLAVGLAMQETGTSIYLVDRLLWLVNQFVPPDQKAIVMLATF